MRGNYRSVQGLIGPAVRIFKAGCLLGFLATIFLAWHSRGLENPAWEGSHAGLRSSLLPECQLWGNNPLRWELSGVLDRRSHPLRNGGSPASPGWPSALDNLHGSWVVTRPQGAFCGESSGFSEASNQGFSLAEVIPTEDLGPLVGTRQDVFGQVRPWASLLPSDAEDFLKIPNGLGQGVEGLCGILAKVGGEFQKLEKLPRDLEWSTDSVGGEWARALKGVNPGKIPWVSTLALMALDASPSEIAQFHRSFHRISRSILKGLPKDDPPGEKDLSELLARLHCQLFTGGYDQSATDVRWVVQFGRYNCVSASILLLDLCRALGWDCRAVEWPSHLACRVAGPGVRWEVELTIPPALWPERAPVRMIGNTEAEFSPQSQWRPRVLSDSQVVAVVYYNKALELLAEGQFRQAFEAQLASVWWDPQNAFARANLVAIMNNWAVQKVREGRPQEALVLLELAGQLAPGFHPVETNLRFLRQSSYLEGHQPSRKDSDRKMGSKGGN